jgi:hypothetical protein
MLVILMEESQLMTIQKLNVFTERFSNSDYHENGFDVSSVTSEHRQIVLIPKFRCLYVLCKITVGVKFTQLKPIIASRLKLKSPEV